MRSGAIRDVRERITLISLLRSSSITVAAMSMLSVAEAATFTVDRIDFDEGDATPGDGICAMSSANGGGCTLRAAVMEANITPEADVIDLPATTVENPLFVRRLRNPQQVGYPFQEFDELDGDIEITGALTLRGSNSNDAAATVISGRGRSETFDPASFDRIFQISPKFGPIEGPLEVVIEGVTLMNGRSDVEDWGGGAILVTSHFNFGPRPFSAPKVILRNVIFRHNYSAVAGGAISNFGGTVDIDNAIFEGNTNSYAPSFIGAQNLQAPERYSRGGQGGAIANWAGVVTVRNSVMSGGYSQAGGAIYAGDASSIATLTVIENSVIRGNFGFMGAAIFNASKGIWDFGESTLAQHGMVLNRVTIESNEAEFAGGAVYNAGTILLSNSVLSKNRAWDTPGSPNYPNKGGGVYNSGRVLDVQSSTIAGNVAEESRRIASTADDSRGGDEFFFDHRKFADQRGSRVSFKNTIVGNSFVGSPKGGTGVGTADDCAGPQGYSGFLRSHGGNVFRDANCASAQAGLSDKVGLDPMLKPLAANGARSIVGGEVVKTMALKPGSPAIGNGILDWCPGSDARNFERVGACDSGAFQKIVDSRSSGNRAPVASSDRISTDAGIAATIKVLANDYDPDVANVLRSSALRLDTISQPGNGAVTLADDNSLVYVPASGFVGTDKFTYQISDGVAQDLTDVIVSVYDPAFVNIPPDATPDFAVISLPDPLAWHPNVPIATLLIDVLANDSDADTGDKLRIERIRGPNPPVFGVELIIPEHQDSGPALWKGLEVRVDGEASGDVSFEYDVADNRGAVTNNVEVKLTINRLPTVMPEDVPKTMDVSAGQSASGITRALDRDGHLLRFSLLQAPPASIGVATVNNATGEYTFTAGTVNGDGSFLIGVSDGNGMVSVPVGIVVLGGTNPICEVRRRK